MSSIVENIEKEIFKVKSEKKKYGEGIVNEMALRILKAQLYSNKQRMNSSILEFRRKKVIKQRVNKFY